MTNEQKTRVAQKLTEWEAGKLLEAYLYYAGRFSPIDDTDDNIKYELIRAEILRRMA